MEYVLLFLHCIVHLAHSPNPTFDFRVAADMTPMMGPHLIAKRIYDPRLIAKKTYLQLQFLSSFTGISCCLAVEILPTIYVMTG